MFICPLSNDEIGFVENQIKENQEEELYCSENSEGKYYLEGELLGLGGKIAVVPFPVPSSDDNGFVKFGERMEHSEKDFCEKLNSVIVECQGLKPFRAE